MKSAKVIALALVGGMALAPMAAGPATAKDDDRREVRLSGSCSKAAEWKLKAKDRDGGIEAEFEVDSNRMKQRWTYRMSVNGTQFASGSRRTTGPSGSFSVERRATGSAGPTTVTARAQNSRSGEVCLATLTM